MLPERLETERLILRPISRSGAPAIFVGYAQDPEVVRYVSWHPHQRLSDTETYIVLCLAAPTDLARTYAPVGRAEGRLLGAFHLRRTELHRVDCGYVLTRPLGRRGLMTEALAAAARWAIGEPDIGRCAIPKTLPRRESWKRPASLARAFCSAGWSIPMSAPSRATASATP